MSLQILTALLVACLVVHAAPIFGQDKAQQGHLIKSIVQTWKERQNTVKTLTCSAKVSSFFPKGSLSEVWSNNMWGEKSKQIPLYPHEDRTITDESAAWDLDFVAKRVKKDILTTIPVYHQDGPELEFSHYLHLFTDGKYRRFEGKNSTQDVTIYDKIQGDAGSLDLGDLPLLWIAGDVTGYVPNAELMPNLAAAEKFLYRGSVEYKGRSCVILSVPEQDAGISVREFWVGAEKPHPIYQCLNRRDDVVSWRFEVEYRTQDGQVVPAQWVETNYNEPGTLFQRYTYTVENLQFNVPLPAELFQKRLEPGMVVLEATESETFVVDSFGNMVPEGSAGTARSLLFWSVVGVAICCAVFLFWRFPGKWFRRAAS